MNKMQETIVQAGIEQISHNQKELAMLKICYFKEKIIPEGVCKQCGGAKEVDLSIHMFSNEDWPQGAYGASKEGERGVWVRCNACNGEGIFADDI